MIDTYIDDHASGQNKHLKLARDENLQFDFAFLRNISYNAHSATDR